MKKSSLILFAAALFVTAVPAFAATIPYEDTNGLPVDVDTILTLPQFDTAMGTLTGVWVQVELRLTGASVELDNDDDAAQNGTARVLNTASSLTSSVPLIKVGFLDSINNGDLTINALQPFALDGTTGDPVGFTATLLGDYGIWTPGTITSGDSGDIDIAFLSNYQGTGNFTITVNSTYVTSATFEGSNGYFKGNTPDGELYGKVIYTYEPIPEPATMTILTISALGFLKRKNGK